MKRKILDTFKPEKRTYFIFDEAAPLPDGVWVTMACETSSNTSGTIGKPKAQKEKK
jgi:hypothetical protein